MRTAEPKGPAPYRAPHGRAAWAVVHLKGLRGLSTRLAHCSGGACQRSSSAPPLQPSPATWPLSRLYATLSRAWLSTSPRILMHSCAPMSASPRLAGRPSALRELASCATVAQLRQAPRASSSQTGMHGQPPRHLGEPGLIAQTLPVLLHLGRQLQCARAVTVCHPERLGQLELHIHA